MTYGVRDIAKTWASTISGTGTVTFNSTRMATCVDPDGASVAYLRRDVVMFPGAEIEVSVLCKTVSGTPRVVINWPSFGVQVSNVRMDQTHPDLTLYTAKYVVPPYGVDTEDGVISIGLVTSDVGECVLYDPRILINGLDLDMFASSIVVDAGGETAVGTGSWVKYADGRMTCKRVVQIVGCSTAWGSLFTSALSAAPSMAKTFVGTVIRKYHSLGGTLGETAWTYTNGSQYGVARGTTSAGTFNVLVEAEGFWRTV